MKREHEWDDFLGVRVRVSRGPYRPTIDYQPSGWNSPIAKKIIRGYWRVTITLIKALIAIPLSILAIAAFWLLWIIITL